MVRSSWKVRSFLRRAKADQAVQRRGKELLELIVKELGDSSPLALFRPDQLAGQNLKLGGLCFEVLLGLVAFRLCPQGSEPECEVIHQLFQEIDLLRFEPVLLVGINDERPECRVFSAS